MTCLHFFQRPLCETTQAFDTDVSHVRNGAIIPSARLRRLRVIKATNHEQLSIACLQWQICQTDFSRTAVLRSKRYRMGVANAVE